MLGGYGGLESEVQKLVTLAIGNEENWDEKKLGERLYKQFGISIDKRKSTVEDSADKLVDELRNEKENATVDDFLDKIRENGTKLIVSYSTAANIISNGEYPIFNARISAALNAIQIIEHPSLSQGEFFPVIQSNDPEIDEFNFFLRKYIRDHHHKYIDSSMFYERYVDILRSVSKVKNIEVGLIEIILSSFSDVLANKGIKKMGAELEEPIPQKVPTSRESKEQAADDAYVDCETTIHGKAFKFKVDEKGITIKREMGRKNTVYEDRFSNELLEGIFTYVTTTKQFSLSNNVANFSKFLEKNIDLIRNKEWDRLDGLGSFVFAKNFEMTGKKDSRLGQAVSHLASIMEKAELLTWKRGKPAKFFITTDKVSEYLPTIKKYYHAKCA